MRRIYPESSLSKSTRSLLLRCGLSLVLLVFCTLGALGNKDDCIADVDFRFSAYDPENHMSFTRK